MTVHASVLLITPTFTWCALDFWTCKAKPERNGTKTKDSCRFSPKKSIGLEDKLGPEEYIIYYTILTQTLTLILTLILILILILFYTVL